MHQFEASKEAHQRELERQAEHQQREMDLKLQQKTMELEHQAEIKQRELESRAADQQRTLELQIAEQRIDMERRLTKQREEFERQVTSQQQEMELRISRQVEAALQMRQQNTMTAATSASDQEFRDFMTTQNRHIQMLTEMVLQIMQPQSQSMLHHTAERLAQVHSEPIQVVEIDREQLESKDGRLGGRKRQFTRTTPTKQASQETHLPFAAFPLETQEFDSDMSIEHGQRPGFQLPLRTIALTTETLNDPEPPSPSAPNHSEYSLYDCSKELSFDSSHLTEEDDRISSPYSDKEVISGLALGDEVVSDATLPVIQEQRTDQRQKSIQRAETHAEMSTTATTCPVSEDPNRLTYSNNEGTINPHRNNE